MLPACSPRSRRGGRRADRRPIAARRVLRGAAAPEEEKGRKHFIRTIVENDLASGKHAGIITRFPPEPNGYLHIGHAKSINLNFGLARESAARRTCDSTTPIQPRFASLSLARALIVEARSRVRARAHHTHTQEDMEYVNSIMEDVRWLNAEGDGTGDMPTPWEGPVRHTSDYFELLHECAVHLIRSGDACVSWPRESARARTHTSSDAREPRRRARARVRVRLAGTSTRSTPRRCANIAARSRRRVATRPIGSGRSRRA